MTTTAAPGSDDAPEAVPAGGLSIGELADRSGVQAATLRMWESRHGFPVAKRLPSGHRRYDAETVESVREVIRRRDAGTRLEVAIAEVSTGPIIPAPSVYAELRRRHHHLLPHRLRKSTLLALTWALEDECCARAQNPWLFGAFQYSKYYRGAANRWRDLARTAQTAWVLAEFDDPRPPVPGGPIEVPLPAHAAMTREWSLVCVAQDFPAALAAWELPGQDDVRDADRVFEAIWTLEPGPVRDAARTCAHVVAELGFDTSPVLATLDRPFAPATTDLRHATSLFNRMMAYVDQLT